MTTVEELVVEMRGDGIDSTADELNRAEGEMDQAGDSMEESAGQMQDFSEKWSGAMGAVVAGLAVAAAGLLAQVPVIGGLMQSLFAVVEAVAFQMDQVLRPILQPIADLFFDFAGAIFSAEGVVAKFWGVLGTLVSFLLLAAGALALVFGKGAVGSAILSGLAAVASVVAGAVGALAAALGAPVIAIAALIAAAAALGVIFREEIMGALNTVIGGTNSFLKAIYQLEEDLAVAFGNMIRAALGWGADLMKNFAKGIRNQTEAVIGAVKDSFKPVMDRFSFDQRENDRMAEQWGRDMVSYFGQGMQTAVSREVPPIELEQGGDGGMRRKDNRVNVSIDGRDVDKETRRFRDRRISRRGRFS
jgi:hypothetical protein